MKLTHHKQTTTHHTLTLAPEDIIDLLRAAGHQLPGDAAIAVQVPGGGDWSNCDLEVSSDIPVTVKWTTRE